MASDEQTPESGAEKPQGGAPQYSPDELQAGAASKAGADVNLDLVLDIPASWI